MLGCAVTERLRTSGSSSGASCWGWGPTWTPARSHRRVGLLASAALVTVLASGYLFMWLISTSKLVTRHDVPDEQRPHRRGT